jgi:hypothetical protein
MINKHGKNPTRGLGNLGSFFIFEDLFVFIIFTLVYINAVIARQSYERNYKIYSFKTLFYSLRMKMEF